MESRKFTLKFRYLEFILQSCIDFKYNNFINWFSREYSNNKVGIEEIYQ